MGLFSGLGKIVKGGIGLLPGGNILNAALDYGVPLVAGLAGSKKQGQADQLRAQTLQRQQQDYAKRAPLRDKALQLALRGPGAAPNLGSLYGAGKNPYSSLSSVPRVAAPPTESAIPAAAPPAVPQGGLAGMGGGVGRLMARARAGEQSGERGNALGGFF